MAVDEQKTKVLMREIGRTSRLPLDLTTTGKEEAHPGIACIGFAEANVIVKDPDLFIEQSSLRKDCHHCVALIESASRVRASG